MSEKPEPLSEAEIGRRAAMLLADLTWDEAQEAMRQAGHHELDDLSAQLAQAQREREEARRMFDVTRHRVLTRLGESDMGHGWNWIEGRICEVLAHLAASQERERGMREAMESIAAYDPDIDEPAQQAPQELARAALAASTDAPAATHGDRPSNAEGNLAEQPATQHTGKSRGVKRDSRRDGTSTPAATPGPGLTTEEAQAAVRCIEYFKQAVTCIDWNREDAALAKLRALAKAARKDEAAPAEPKGVR